MPFFAESPWMQSVNRLWLWALLTAPSTMLCFLFYTYWSRNETKRKAKHDEEEMITMSGGQCGSDEQIN